MQACSVTRWFRSENERTGYWKSFPFALYQQVSLF